MLRDAREVEFRFLEIRARVLERDGDDLAAAIEVAVQVLELGLFILFRLEVSLGAFEVATFLGLARTTAAADCDE